MTIDHQPGRTNVENAPSRRPVEEDEPDYVVRGWRSWSVRRNDDRSSGSEIFEWRVNRRREGGSGKE